MGCEDKLWWEDCNGEGGVGCGGRTVVDKVRKRREVLPRMRREGGGY